MDLTGIDVNYYVRVDRYAESHDPYDAPNPLVIEKFQERRVWKKDRKRLVRLFRIAKNKYNTGREDRLEEGVQYYVIQHDSDYHYLYQ